MEAIRLHMTGGHLSGRVIAVAAIVLLLCAMALGVVLLGVHMLAVDGTSSALGTFDAHAPTPQAGPPVTPSLFDANGVSQPLSGPDEITLASRSRA